MTNRQPDIEELLCDYIDGTLSAAQKTEVEALLASDAQLRQTVHDMMQVRGMLKDLPVEALPVETANAIRRETQTPTRMRWQMPSGLRLAAALLLSATVAVVIWAMLPTTAMRRPIASAAKLSEAAPEEKIASADQADKEIAKAPAPTVFAKKAEEGALATATPPAAAAPTGPALAAKTDEGSATRTPSAAATPVASKAKATNEAESQVAAGPGPLAGGAPAGMPAQGGAGARAESKMAAAPPTGYVPPPAVAPAGALAKGGPEAGGAEAVQTLQEQPAEQQALAYTGPPQVMVVKASNIPAIQREIDILLGAGNNREMVTNAGPDFGMAQKSDQQARARGTGFGGGLGGAPAAAPAAKQAAQEPLGRPLGRQAQSGPVVMKSPATLPLNGPTAPPAPSGQTIVVRNLSPEQLASLRENVLALANRPNVQIDDQTTLGLMERRAQQQQLRVNQMQRQMPSVQTRDLQDALQAQNNMAQNAQDQAQNAQNAQATMDLTIILEPSPPLPPSPLPAAGKPATLPPGAARQR